MLITSQDFKLLLQQRCPALDVRAPVEFAQGHWPEAVNLPLLSDEERTEVGTCYKLQGRDAAIRLGYEIVSGEVKKLRVQAWIDFFRHSPNGFLYCYRGGLRSRIAQSWMQEQGFQIPRLADGYKDFRNNVSEFLDRWNRYFIVISGMTGSRKTILIEELIQNQVAALDLEFRARHRGSAFGSRSVRQPSQIQFEIDIARDLMDFEQAPVIFIEDESRMIGQRVVPKNIFESLRQSPLLMIEDPVEERASHILGCYVLHELVEREVEMGFERALLEIHQNFLKAVAGISKKLGGMLTQEVLQLLNQAYQHHASTGESYLHLLWIEKLLTSYYDPLYRRSLELRQPVILKKGSFSDIRAEIYSDSIKEKLNLTRF